MSTILNIETSGSPCSVALCSDGFILAHREDFSGHNHAAMLSGFIKECLDHAHEKKLRLDAVAVSAGPGSYTGLRIGLSEAKGLAYSLDIPLIAVDTLKLMTVKAMFSLDLEPSVLFAPMIDARRMEIYTAVHTMALEETVSPRAVILTADEPFSKLLTDGAEIMFFGNGAKKAKELLGQYPMARFIEIDDPVATDMTALSELAMRNKEFMDLAYGVPNYIKPFYATTPKKQI